jgi:hypothetical protein
MLLSYKGLEFKSLKFKEDKTKYPWKSDKQEHKFFEDLVEEGSEISKVKYKNLMQLQYNEDIHIKLSYSMISEYLMYAMMVFVFIFIYLKILVPSLVCLGLSFGLYFLSKYLNKKLQKLYIYKKINLVTVDFLFKK